MIAVLGVIYSGFLLKPVHELLLEKSDRKPCMVPILESIQFRRLQCRMLLIISTQKNINNIRPIQKVIIIHASLLIAWRKFLIKNKNPIGFLFFFDNIFYKSLYANIFIPNIFFKICNN